jgi:hypothetical protein
VSRMRWTCAWVLIATIAAADFPAFGQQKEPPAPLSQDAAQWEHRITGKIVSINKDQLQVETREKRNVEIDASEAIKNFRVNSYSTGSLITVYGAYDAKGVLHAQSIQRAKNLPSAWPADR